MSTEKLPAIRPSELGQPIYRGSVQHLYAVPGREDLMVCETTNAGSVFDVGSIFDIPGSDVARATFRHALYTRMGKPETWAKVRDAIITARDGSGDALSAASWRTFSAGRLKRCSAKAHARITSACSTPQTGEVFRRGRSFASEHVQRCAALPRDEAGAEAVPWRFRV